MIVLDANNKALILESIYTPTIADHIWVLDFNMMDYTLAPLLVLEEMVCPAVEVMINDFRFLLPAYWNMLVVDEETYQLDVVLIEDLAGKEFTALVYGPDMVIGELAVVRVMDFIPSAQIVGPFLNKHQMLCHPISPTKWISIAPSDSYNKYLKNTLMGDII